jgi:hypothetical protein
MIVRDAVELGERSPAGAPHRVEQRARLDLVEQRRVERGAQPALQSIGRYPRDAGDHDARAAAGITADQVWMHDLAGRDYRADRKPATGVEIRHPGGVDATLELRDRGQLPHGLALHPDAGAGDEDRVNHAAIL